MASLPQIALQDDKAVLSLSFPHPSRQFSEFGTFKSKQASIIAFYIPGSLHHLLVFLGPSANEIDDLAFDLVLKRVASHCHNLTSLSITSYSEAWNSQRSNMVLRWTPPPAMRTMHIHIIDPDENSHASSTKRGSRHWSSAIFPLQRVLDESLVTTLCQPMRLKELVLLPPSAPRFYMDHRNKMLATLTRLLSRSRDLRKLSLPLDVSLDLSPVLFMISALPYCNELELIQSSTHTPFSRLLITSALVQGLNGFDHLQRLCIPAETLCEPLRRCLGDLQSLQELKIEVTSSQVQNTLSPPTTGQFPVLHTLEIIGSFSVFKQVVRAIAQPGETSLRRIYVATCSLSSQKEMGKAFHIMFKHCPRVEELGIRIRGVHKREKMDWLDLTYLDKFNLKDFVITHPRPLALTDRNVQRLLVAWPNATYISLNPSPSLPAWNTASGTKAPLPTLDTLIHVSGRALHHFGVHLNPRAAHSINSGHSFPTLQVLDLGSSRCSKRLSVLIQKLFPNTTFSGR